MLASRGGAISSEVHGNFALKRNGIGKGGNPSYPFTFNLPTKKGNKMRKKDSTKRTEGRER